MSIEYKKIIGTLCMLVCCGFLSSLHAVVGALPQYVSITNYFVAGDVSDEAAASNEYAAIEFETGDVLRGRVVVSTNLSGVVSRSIARESTNQWGHVSTNLLNLSSLQKKVNLDLTVSADFMEYDRDTGWAEAKGRVTAVKGNQKLQSVYARVNTLTEEVYAAGNVELTRGATVWKGKVLTGNMATRQWNTGEFTGNSGPFRILEGGSIALETNGFYELNGTAFTTCTNAYPGCHYHLKMRRAAIKPGRLMKGWGGAYYMADIPLLYLPFWKLDLRPDFGWRIYPGHSSRLGSYLLSSYRYRMSPVFRGETHVDYMSERGVALGQDLKWDLKQGIPILGIEQGAGYGQLETYWLDDKKPIDDDEDSGTSDIDETRYRVLLRNTYSITDRDYTMLNASYMSDTDVLEDFFEDEYRVYHTPDNFFIYGHNGDDYSLSLSTRFRLNDFFEGVNRLPEASIDWLPQQIGETYFFYEGRTALGSLERVFAASNTNTTDYSAVRFDTWHEISRPEKLFGFLNVVPRVSYRGTYYSETYESTNVLSVVTTTVTNPVVSTQSVTNSQEVITDAGADYRNMIGFGSEFSFKAFKQWGDDIKPRRHVLEPYANYTFVPEPDLLSENVYQFDGVDSQYEQHTLRLGMRNKLQKKVRRSTGYSPYDIIDLDLFTIYDLDASEGEDALSNVWMDLEWSPLDDFMMEADARYSLTDSEVALFNMRGLYSAKHKLRAFVEWRYRPNDSSLLIADCSLFPGREGWSPSVYTRYEMEESRMEEAGLYFRKTYDCMVFRVGGRALPGYTRPDGTEKDDEFKATFEFWLRAFPEYGMKRKKSGYDRTNRF